MLPAPGAHHGGLDPVLYVAQTVHPSERSQHFGLEDPLDRSVSLPETYAPAKLAVRASEEPGDGTVGTGDRQADLPESLGAVGLSVAKGLARNRLGGLFGYDRFGLQDSSTVPPSRRRASGEKDPFACRRDPLPGSATVDRGPAPAAGPPWDSVERFSSRWAGKTSGDGGRTTGERASHRSGGAHAHGRRLTKVPCPSEATPRLRRLTVDELQRGSGPAVRGGPEGMPPRVSDGSRRGSPGSVAHDRWYVGRPRRARGRTRSRSSIRPARVVEGEMTCSAGEH
jgi:hypothetical protein